VQRLAAQAKARGLAWHRAWLRLGHFRRSLDGQHFASDADGAHFFLSAEGKRDPEAELRATLEAFFLAPQPSSYSLRDPRSLHPVCRFPARFLWLHKHLGFDVQRLPVKKCPRLALFIKALQPQSVSLVFSSYYLNNPASAFGHTFLRINKGIGSHATKQRELLDNGIDFSADVETSNAFFYALGGLTGTFPGTFKHLPYYYKVRQYNDYESRDLWEYRLNLRPEQVWMLVLHLWELGSTHFDYYYLTRNCSYYILDALEAAAPNLTLINQLHFPVLPVDTVKALYANPGLIAGVEFRPSIRTQFQRALRRLQTDERAFALELTRQPSHKLPEHWPAAKSIRVLDVAVDLVDMRSMKTLLAKTDPHAAQVRQQLLERRAVFSQPSPAPNTSFPKMQMPHLGHDSRRFDIGAGYSRRGAAFLNLGARLALHDLADPTTGYPELSQIEFLPTRLRYQVSEQRLQVEDLQLVRVISLHDISVFDPQLSWKFSVGVTTLSDRTCANCFAGQLIGGGGVAKSLFDQHLTLFLTFDLAFYTGPRLQGWGDAPLRLGLGPAAGLRYKFTPNLLFLLQGQAYLYPEQNPTPWLIGQASSTLRFQYTQGWALSFETAVSTFNQEARLVSMTYF